MRNHAWNLIVHGVAADLTRDGQALSASIIRLLRRWRSRFVVSGLQKTTQSDAVAIALLRYARVLQQSARTLPDLLTAPAPSTATLAAAARRLVIVPLLYQRLHTLATAAASKALQRQIKGLQAEVPSTSLCEQFQTFPAFVDAYTYFHRLAETLRPLLDAPPLAETLQLPAEAEAPPRPVRPQRRLRHRRALRHAE